MSKDNLELTALLITGLVIIVIGWLGAWVVSLALGQ